MRGHRRNFPDFQGKEGKTEMVKNSFRIRTLKSYGRDARLQGLAETGVRILGVVKRTFSKYPSPNYRASSSYFQTPIFFEL
jgi:hypothetical protein